MLRSSSRTALRQFRGEEGGGACDMAADYRVFIRIETLRAWPASPSASPSAIAAGPRAASWSGPHLRRDVRLRKSRTPSPEENRAERAVGRTWLEPPT